MKFVRFIFKLIRECEKTIKLSQVCVHVTTTDIDLTTHPRVVSRQHFRGNSRFKWSHMLVTGRKLWRENGIHVSQKWYIHNQSQQSVHGTKEAFLAYFSSISLGLNSDPILLWKVTPKPEIAPRLVILQL